MSESSGGAGAQPAGRGMPPQGFQADAPPRVRSCPSLVAASFEAVQARLEGRDARSIYTDAAVVPAGERCPLFVTFNVASAAGGRGCFGGGGGDGGLRLRGCIGSLEPLEVRSGVTQFAQRSAFSDRRFPPITASELPRLHCCVSLLTNYERADHVHDWVVGTHGIILEFRDPRGTRRSATYLPEVAGEQGWNQREAIESLVQKAGWAGAITQAMLDAASLTRYQSSKCSMSYQHFKDSWLAGVPADAATAAGASG